MLTNSLKHYPFSLIIVILVILLSVCPIGAPDLAKDVPLADKWTHMVMYFVMAVVICGEYYKCHRPQLSLRSMLVWGIFVPALLGGMLELVQNYCTTYRSGEWLDLVADSLGALVGGAIAIITSYRIS